MRAKISVELVIAALLGMVVASIIYSVQAGRMEARINEIRQAQITNSDRAHADRQRLEAKIDSFILLNKNK